MMIIGQLCMEDLEGINTWDNPMTDNPTGDTILGETGKREFRAIGK